MKPATEKVTYQFKVGRGRYVVSMSMTGDRVTVFPIGLFGEGKVYPLGNSHADVDQAIEFLKRYLDED